ncbi:putative nuclease HARBI1 [Coffea eugenioides]|uniref:putative nuclease HARBI1 n=1 Tax=Coffea eugenioides TaxID=49369 RepID=UPI000F61284D|nr:putative nuclease HARBI1 [Coffea eugenioides]
MLKSGLLTPYRGVAYHLKEYSNRGPRDYRELFNLRHASLRNAIERAFGVLKKRFPIIGDNQPTYDVNTQSKIVLACCILHNFLMEIDPDLEYIDEVDAELAHQSPIEDENIASTSTQEEDSSKGEFLRNQIAMQMWNDYVV